MSSTDVSFHLSQLLCLTTGHLWDDGDSGLQSFSNLNSGKLLLEWLSVQILTDHGLKSDGDRLLGDHNDEQMTGIDACVRDVLLETDETSILNVAKSSPNDGADLPTIVAPADYMPPSRLKKHTEYINNETVRIQHEARVLRTRISQTKDACTKSAQSIKLLQNAAYILNSDTRECKDEISELSISADATIISTLDISQNLLCDLGFSLQSTHNNDSTPLDEGNKDLEPDRVFLLRTQIGLSNITRDLQTYSKDYRQLREQEAVKIQDLDHEARRLVKAFKPAQYDVSPKSGRSLGLDQTLLQKSEEIFVLLERECEGDGPVSHARFVALLSWIDEEDRAKLPEGEELSVEEMTARAWKIDQAAIMKCHKEKLNETLASLDLALFPLENLHSRLFRFMHCVQDAEATLEALGEELGGIDVEHRSSTNNNHLGKDDDLQHELKSILIDCKFLYSGSASPILLLDKGDILAQLHLLKVRFNSLEVSQKAWAHNMIREYSLRPLHPLLINIYSESPLNSSPPFEFSESVHKVEAQTRIRTQELQTLSNSLEEEVNEAFGKDDNLKRLQSFVDRWSSSMSADP